MAVAVFITVPMTMSPAAKYRLEFINWKKTIRLSVDCSRPGVSSGLGF
jgi:hypothetical protein